MKIVVTGAAGGMGRVLIPRLCARADVAQVLGIDRTVLAQDHPKFSMQVGDLRAGSCERWMAGADVVIHLAFAIIQGTMSAREMHDNNVLGALNVFKAAREQGVRKVVNLSSVSVYGSGEGLDESAPLAPSPRFPYACQKAQIEQTAAADFADLPLVHLRSTFILGPNALPFLKKICASRLYVAPRRPHPRIQVVHEDDVATAIVTAATTSAVGAFNIAASDIVTVPQLIRNGRWFVLGVPVRWVARLPKAGEAALELLRTPLTVSCRRARDTLGWAPRYSAWEARAACR